MTMRNFGGYSKSLMALVACSLSAQAMVPINMTSRFSQHSNVVDHRTGGIGEFSLSKFDFVFGLRAFNSDEYKSQIQFMLPLRTLQSSSVALAPIGSEFGGYQVSWNQTIFDFIGWDLHYIESTSNRLGLFENNKSFETNLTLRTQNFLSSSILLRTQAGPGIRISSAYSPMYSAKAGVEAIMQSEFLGKIAVGTGANYRIRQADGLSSTLLTLQPQISWELVKDLWISAQYTRALQRPSGREQTMGDATLSGLYGDTFGIGLSTASL